MSTFMNVSGVDLDLYVDGSPHAVDAGETVTVADEFDYTLTDQAAWQISPASVAVSPPPVRTCSGAGVHPGCAGYHPLRRGVGV